MATATVVDRKIYIFGGANSAGSRHDTSGFCDLYELNIGKCKIISCVGQYASHSNSPVPY